MNIFNHIKDKALSIIIEKMLSHLIADLGSITRFSIDTNSKSVFASLHLKGETQNIDVNISPYEIKQNGNKIFLDIKAIRTSREWINILVDQYLPFKRLEIPNNLIGKVTNKLL
jgi:hypothetical protein